MNNKAYSIIKMLLSAWLALSCSPTTSRAADRDPVILKERTENGRAEVRPDFGVAGEWGTWRVTYVVGEPGIDTDGGIRVQLPDAWHAGSRNSAIPLQASNPQGNHYVSAWCSIDETTLRTWVESESNAALVKHPKVSLDGRSERYVFVVRVQVKEGNLQAGDKITVVYGDRSKGSPGYRAGTVSTEPLPILLAVDADGDSRFRLLNMSPLIDLRPGTATGIQVHLPSQGLMDEPVSGLVSLTDQESNPVEHAAVVDLFAHNGSAQFPKTVSIPAGKGHARFKLTPTAPETLRLRARVRSFPLEAISNPCVVTSELSEEKIYWGDLHSHTHYSWDGVGSDSFRYARYIAGLDFYAMTDHAISPSDGHTRGLGPHAWEEYTDLVQEHHDPPDFVTIHAYECSLGKPFGHHNVYFRDRPGALITSTGSDLHQLWEALKEGEALTIPHHTGKFPAGIDFNIHHPGFRRNIEIYSGHGLSETYDPDHPLSFEHSLFTSDARSLKHPSYAQDAWRLGLYLSSIGSSDDHRAHPGLPHYGLTAVKAPTRSRAAIFQGLYDRRTYATSGAKIVLNFTLNNQPMGSVVHVEAAPLLFIQAVGTDGIEKVELLRHQEGEDRFQVIQSWKPDRMRFSAEYNDPGFKPGSIYYCRLTQTNTVRGRAVMAWSSPIWTRKATK